MKYHQNRDIGLFSSAERLTELEALGDPLQKLLSHVDFEFFRPRLEAVLYQTDHGMKGGRPPFDPVFMFKVLVLQRLYNLSDDAAEYQIKDRLTFMRFLGLDYAGRVPDSKTIWYFRNELQKHDLVKLLFDQLTWDLEERGIIAKQGQIVDATFVEAPRQRNTPAETETIKAGEVPAPWQDTPKRLEQKDVDARWAKKGEATHYGYKNHIACDSKSKLITQYAVTHAAAHDSTTLDELLAEDVAHGQKLYADSAYRSAGIEEKLVQLGIESKVHEKGARNRALTAAQVARNKKKSRVRARVEHIFGFMTQAMGGLVVRARNLARNGAVIGMINMVYNLCRVVQLKQKLVVATT